MCTVEIRPGRGGQDAERFAARIGDSVRAWAGRQSRAVAVMSADARAVTIGLPSTPADALG